MTRISDEGLDELIAACDSDAESYEQQGDVPALKWAKTSREEAAALRELRAYRKAGWVPIKRTFLEAAKCPDDECAGRGWTARQFGPNEWEQVECQWCRERHDALAAAPEPQEEP